MPVPSDAVLQEGCKVGLTLVNLWREEKTKDGDVISPGIYLLSVTDWCHNHELSGPPDGSAAQALGPNSRPFDR
jgi:hypothetical protein